MQVPFEAGLEMVVTPDTGSRAGGTNVTFSIFGVPPRNYNATLRLRLSGVDTTAYSNQCDSSPIWKSARDVSPCGRLHMLSESCMQVQVLLGLAARARGLYRGLSVQV